MSVTDELREFKGHINAGLAPETVLALRSEINCIADRIDAEYQREVNKEVMNALYMPNSLVALPYDADGEAIHIGDTLDGYGETTVVKGLTLGDDGWSMTCENGLWFNFAAFTHHHEPTVEEVMQEMLEQAVGYSDAHTTVALNAIAKYAAKLRLADDCEEQ